MSRSAHKGGGDKYFLKQLRKSSIDLDIFLLYEPNPTTTQVPISHTLEYWYSVLQKRLA